MSKKIIFALGLLSLFSCANPIDDIQMVLVEGGEFFMGSEDEDADEDEKPVLVVNVNAFLLGKYEVTQALWVYVMGANPSYFQNPDFPVESVSHQDVELFLRRLNSMTGKKYRLPSEAEWEYAARGGNRHISSKYSGNDSINVVAWYKGNSDEQTHPTGKLQGNVLGIYDMTGNVHEWCRDNYNGTDYSGRVVNQDTCIFNVFRGGSFYSEPRYCRIANRNHAPFHTRNFSLGFRLAHDVE